MHRKRTNQLKRMKTIENIKPHIIHCKLVHLFSSCFHLTPILCKSGKFQRVKDGNRTHRLFGHVFANTYWQVWGIVYLTRGLPEPPNG